MDERGLKHYDVAQAWLVKQITFRSVSARVNFSREHSAYKRPQYCVIARNGAVLSEAKELETRFLTSFGTGSAISFRNEIAALSSVARTSVRVLMHLS